MDKFKDFRKSGTFKLASGVEVNGELSLKQGATSLDLYSGTFFDTHQSKDITGTFHDRSKVSLINCITMQGPGTSSRSGERYHFSNVFPNLVLLGEDHITSTDRKVVEVSFVVDDAPSIFYDFDAFGTVTDARAHMERIVESKNNEGQAIKLGEYPQIFYFTGKHEIFSIHTVLGRISATHGISYKSPGPKGIHVQNTIRLNIAFPDEKTVDEAIDFVFDTLRFLQLVAGRPQNIVELSFRLASLKDELRNLDAYWCLAPSREKDDEYFEPHPADLPLQAGRDPNNFATILTRWLDRNDAWRNARARHAIASAHQSRYDTDRLVGAANMFDIMPAEAFPRTVTLSPELDAARNAARTAFRELPSTPERDSILNALGRIGRPALKQKIRSRIDLITSRLGTWFPELEMVTDQAVDCRNYYVHGTPGKFDYGIYSDQTIFFTDALEFVFAASDLIEAGWDIARWVKQPTSMTHPFGRFRVVYADRLAALKAIPI
jgi:ApeA N-terminal domain 1